MNIEIGQIWYCNTWEKEIILKYFIEIKEVQSNRYGYFSESKFGAGPVIWTDINHYITYPEYFDFLGYVCRICQNPCNQKCWVKS